MTRTLGVGRPIAAAAFLLLLPIVISVPAPGAVALVGSVWIGLHVYELYWCREERAQRRTVDADEAALNV